MEILGFLKILPYYFYSHYNLLNAQTRILYDALKIIDLKICLTKLVIDWQLPPNVSYTASWGLSRYPKEL